MRLGLSRDYCGGCVGCASHRRCDWDLVWDLLWLLRGVEKTSLKLFVAVRLDCLGLERGKGSSKFWYGMYRVGVCRLYSWRSWYSVHSCLQLRHEKLG